MRRPRLRGFLVLVAVLTLVAAACAKEETGGTTETGGGNDLLARVMKDGVISVSTDPKYPPQSYLNPDTGEWEGFDIDVATEIAKRLGVDVEWITPNWGQIISGAWNDRWDMSVGSMTITPERSEVLHFTAPYYYTPASIAVHKTNTTVTDLATDLDGKQIGVCSGCTYDFYLQGTLKIPGETFDFVVDDSKIVGYDTDSTAIEALSLGDGVRLDAVMSSITTLQGAIDAEKPIKIVGDPLFYEPLAVAFDKEAPLDPTSLVDKVDGIVQEMHDDGTLTEISNRWFGYDLSMKAS